jgi:monoamine oxidase
MNAASSLLSLIDAGLPRTDRPCTVIVVGAGMAGLVAAEQVARAGHDPIVLEARHRVGGRIYTLRDPFMTGLYAEAGAMRLPRSHDLTMAYVERFGLETEPFTMGNPDAYCFVNGVRRRQSEVLADPDCLGFDVLPDERGKSPARLWEEALSPVTARLDEGGDEGWREVVERYDRLTLRGYLRERGWSEGAIELWGLLSGYEARMAESFVDIVLPEIGQSFSNMVELVGGSDLLPRAFLARLGGRIRFGARMTAIDQSPTDVTVHYRTGGARMRVTGDHAIITTPFSVLRHVETIKPFSRSKQRAIRELHYDASAKVFLQFRRRFWEEDDGIRGGGTISDLAIRNTYYPDHGRETGRGVVLASYTWAEDALRWASLSPAHRIVEALEDVAKIHPQAPEAFEVGASHIWQDDEFACGAFALFKPEQETNLYQAIVAPEGRIHFAGEHASLYHRWIQGAIESGLRAAQEVCDAARSDVGFPTRA